MQRDSLLERGKVRLAQNSASHQQHSEEIALGLALGPLSDKHRWGGGGGGGWECSGIYACICLVEPL